MDIKLKNKSEITGTHWIEFNTSDTLGNYKHWDDNSKYLDEKAYNFYTDIFEKVADNFNYYGETRFDKDQLKKLKLHISDRIKIIDSLTSIQDIIELGKEASNSFDIKHVIEDVYGKQYDQASKLKYDLRILGQSLTDLIENCIQQGKTLIILGL